MKIRMLQVGKPRDAPAVALHDRYVERIERLGVGYAVSWVPEVQPDGRFSDEHVREREARALLEELDAKSTAIALDRGGQSLTSEELSRRLERWATPRATFVIGGPLGLHGGILDRADWRWSLSPLTFPHELARVIVAEQLYRALTLLRGVPYHK